MSASCGPDLSARLVRGAFPPGHAWPLVGLAQPFGRAPPGAPSQSSSREPLPSTFSDFSGLVDLDLAAGNPFSRDFGRKPALPRSSWRGGATRRDEIGRIREGSVADCCRGSPALVGNPWRKMKDGDQERRRQHRHLQLLRTLTRKDEDEIGYHELRRRGPGWASGNRPCLPPLREVCRIAFSKNWTGGRLRSAR